MRFYFNDGDKTSDRITTWNPWERMALAFVGWIPQRGFAPRMLGKDEVGGSNPPSSSKALNLLGFGAFVISREKKLTSSLTSKF